jgi:phage tail sheath protein FI
MPEYLTPGVYLEETSFRSKSIEGVPTSTFGMAGRTRYGPVPCIFSTAAGNHFAQVLKPTLIGSFTEYERAFGGLGDDGTLDGNPLYLAHNARMFFENGGQRLYVARVFSFAQKADGSIDTDKNFAKVAIGNAGTWYARWPGSAGASISVTVRFRRGKNILVGSGTTVALKGVAPGAGVEQVPDRTNIPKDSGPSAVPPVPASVKIVGRTPDGKLGYDPGGGAVVPPSDIAPGAICHITLDVEVKMGDGRLDTYTGLELGGGHPRAIDNVLHPETPTDELSLVWFERNPAATDADVLAALVKDNGNALFLSGGDDGEPFSTEALKGEESDPDDAKKAAKGLAALDEIDDIAIVAAPDIAALPPAAQKEAVDAVIAHCEDNRYRIGIIDPPDSYTSISGIRDFRAQFDTKYAAMYYPWVDVLDPTAKNDPGAPPATVALPPSGFAAGIYARSDVERGVHKAPANEVMLGMSRFRTNVTYDRQAVLNPEGINALRFFPGRSNRVWGARTMSSDPEWKYVNVRRLFIYLEHSIDKSTQWAVFEPNNERLWANIRQTIEDFLTVVWKTGALMGTKPEEAFFVRCDRTTMTQNDLDNGRLICLIGVAPTYPAEFVIFRIGQWTASANKS